MKQLVVLSYLRRFYFLLCPFPLTLMFFANNVNIDFIKDLLLNAYLSALSSSLIGHVPQLTKILTRFNFFFFSFFFFCKIQLLVTRRNIFEAHFKKLIKLMKSSLKIRYFHCFVILLVNFFFGKVTKRLLKVRSLTLFGQKREAKL